MKMAGVNLRRSICLLFLIIMAGSVFAIGEPVYDVMQDINMGVQLSDMDDQLKTLGQQYTELQSQTKHLKNEINKIADGNFTQSEITRELKKVDDLIKQASKADGESYQAGASRFSKNYPGYSTIDSINSGVSYDDFYKNNANTTLATLDNSMQAIEQDKTNNSGVAVDSTIVKARANILNADGATQAVSSLAEVNIEILKQLQSMHMQLASMATSQNAAAAKQIQEEATEKAEARKKLDADAVSDDYRYGQYPLKLPNF